MAAQYPKHGTSYDDIIRGIYDRLEVLEEELHNEQELRREYPILNDIYTEYKEKYTAAKTLLGLDNDN